MPFNGAGVYSPPGADFPAVTQTVISSTHYNNVINDIATGLSLCLTKDGQQTATANIPFGGFRATNVGITAIAGSVGTPAINVSDTGTGLYRSAVSELAVTVAGTQRARFDSTGLIVTGAASVSTTLTATTSVVTPLVAAATDIQFQIGTNGAGRWGVQNSANNYDLVPTVADNTASIASPAGRVKQVFTPIIDSGTTGSLSLKTNNGTTQFAITHVATAVNNWTAEGNTAGNPPTLRVAGSDTNPGGNIATKGTGTLSLLTGGGIQLGILDTASSTRNITITGSNGGNPTIGVTAGNLAITPTVVIAGMLQVGTTPGLAGGAIGIPFNVQIVSRNQANSADVAILGAITRNAISDITNIGGNSVGVVGKGRSGGAAPGTSDLLSGEWAIWRDTVGATTKLYYNNAGTIQSVALA